MSDPKPGEWVPFRSFRSPLTGSDADEFVEAFRMPDRLLPSEEPPPGRASGAGLQTDGSTAREAGSGSVLDRWRQPAPNEPPTAEPATVQPERSSATGSADEIGNHTQGSAIRNAATLGGSLLMTTAIGFAVQLLATTLLGPERAGRVATGEALAGLLLGLLSFGFDMYVRKEVAVRPGHAKEVVPGTLLLRFVATVPVTLLIVAVLRTLGTGGEVIGVFVAFAVGRYLLQSNDVLAACLHAVGDVRGLPMQNLISKLVAAITVLGSIALGVGALSVPLGLVAGEFVKATMLVRRTGRRLALWSQPRQQQVIPVLRKSVPYLTTIIVISFAMFVDVTLLSFLVPDAEVGYYRFSQQLTQVAFVVGTVVPWVVLPMASRAAAESRRALSEVMCRSMELVLVCAIPIAVLLALHADTLLGIVDSLGKSSYTPSTNSLRILAISVIATYVSTLANSLLQADGRLWVGVRSGVTMIVIDIILVLATARFGYNRWGAGGAGVAAAGSILIAETVGMLILVFALGPRAWDASSLATLKRLLLTMVPLFLTDIVLRRLGCNDILRAFIDLAVLAANVALLRVVDVPRVRGLLRPHAV